MNIQSIPSGLRDLKQWILWRRIQRDGETAKVPVDIFGKAGAQTHPDRWATFDEAVEALPKVRAAGLGFAFDPASGVLGVDLDSCIDEGAIEPWAEKIVKQLDSYTELSPSGAGLHIYLRAQMPKGGNRKGDVEIYASGRFFTVTGKHFPGTPQEVMERQAELDELHAEYFPAKAEPPERAGGGEPSDLSDAELFDKAISARDGFKFAALWRGDTTSYDGDDSRADLALVNLLAFWTGGDEARIDRMFRQSALFRAKWERADYRARTIGRALVGRTDYYKPNEKARPAGEPPPQEEEHGPDDYNLTDLGNAERLTSRFGDEIRFCHNNGFWYHWTGKQWRMDNTGAVERRAITTIRDFYLDAWASSNPDRRKKLAKWALTSEGNSRIKSMIDLAKSSLPVAQGDFDADPWLLNCRNGVVDLRTGNLIEHEPRMMMAKITQVIYDPGVDQSLWLAFLQDATGGDEELMKFLQRAAGYSLTGSVSEEVLLFVHGPGAAGKSTFVESMRCALGDYATTLDFEVLLKKDISSGGTGPNAELAKLPGIRFCASEEVDQGKRLAEGLVKNLTGNTQVSARMPHARLPVEFVPQFKLWLVANDAPNVRSDDDAIWRRILRCPFTEVVPVEKRDKTLKERLRNPDVGGRAVLAWAVQGCLEWQDHGLNPPDVVREATDALRAEMDPLTDFFDDCCIFVPTAYTKTSELRRNYEEWCKDNGVRPVSGKRFGDLLRRAGCQATVSNSIRGWFGIGIRDESVRIDPYSSTDRIWPNQSQSTDSTDDSSKLSLSEFAVHESLQKTGEFGPIRTDDPEETNGRSSSVEQSVTVRKMPDGGIVRYLPDGSVEI